LHDEIGGNRLGRSEQIVPQTGRRMIEARIVDRPRCQSQRGSGRHAGQAEAHDFGASMRYKSPNRFWNVVKSCGCCRPCDSAAFASLPIRLILPLSKSAKKESETFSS
jgi:hypothetical protein